MIRDILEGGGGQSLVSVQKSLPLLDAAHLLQMRSRSAVLVVDSEGVCGILSDRDLVKAVATRAVEIAVLTVDDVMHRSLVTCTLDDDVSETLDRMSTAGVQHIPVLSDGQPVTMLSSREFDSVYRFLKTQAETDDLTNLSNRRSFLRAMRYELEFAALNQTPLALAFLDVDLFKQINDQLGHSAGDDVLQKVAFVLATESRSFDCVARIGGDEFAILFPRTKLHQAMMACRRILGSCTRLPLRQVEGIDQISLSAGVTVTRPGDTVEDLMKRADVSLYEAKAAGRGRVVAARSTRHQELNQAKLADQDGTVVVPTGKPARSDDDEAIDQALVASSNI